MGSTQKVSESCGSPERHGYTPEVLRNIARLDIGGNAPWLADELIDLADRLELEMNGVSTYRPERSP